MGVPAFFRWLQRKYPSIVVNCIEEKPKIISGEKIPVDISPNPNDVVDNLYLDMNSIIHPCCHPENKSAPKDEDEMMVAMFEYIDRIFRIVRPRRLLYMAIDGVPPRAKMNQQRSRRFRAHKESVEKIQLLRQKRQELESKGAILPPERTEHFDSNCITPGTHFMDRLAKGLHYYILDRINHDPGWKDIKVILSDASVPGEGEHKIMDFIRKEKLNPNHDANTRHCVYGADVDLIMLGLVTHEANFTIMREKLKPYQPRPCELCNQRGHEMKDCTGAAKGKQGELNELEKPLEIDVDVKFIFIRLNVLREYLAKELAMDNLPFPYDLERAIDDWVFICFFVGNDFLPQLPSLEIGEGAIERLVDLYKKAVTKTGGFVTDSGTIELRRLQLIFTDLAKVEDEILEKRNKNELKYQENKKKRKFRSKEAYMAKKKQKSISITPSPVQNAHHEAYQMRMYGTGGGAGSNQGPLKEEIAPCTSSIGQPQPQSSLVAPSTSSIGQPQPQSSLVDEPEDDVLFLKETYYTKKFGENATQLRREVAASYIEGLAWILKYYVKGCPSWTWHYHHHYAPFASDLANVGDLKIHFEKGAPFSPLEQLMAVLPAGSRQHVPAGWRELMVNPDSPIIQFYPRHFKVDLNGKKYAWQGVALLPFVDEKELKQPLDNSKLTPEEQKRNGRGNPLIYRRKGSSEDLQPEATIKSPIHSLPDIAENAAIWSSFIDLDEDAQIES